MPTTAGMKQAIATASQAALAEVRDGNLPGSSGQSSQTPVAQTVVAPAKVELPEYLRDLDVSGMTTEQIQRVVKKFDLVYGDAQRKTTEASQMKQQAQPWVELDSLARSKPELATRIQELVDKAQRGEPLTAAEVKRETKEVKTAFDELLEKAETVEELNTLKKLESAIVQLSGKNELEQVKNQLANLQKEFTVARGSTMKFAQDSFRASLSQLPESLKSLASKHEQAMVDLSLKYPGLDAKRILLSVAPIEEYEQAVVQAHQSKTEKETEAKKGQQIGAVAGVNANSEKLPEKIPSKSIMYGDRWNTKEILKNIMPNILRQRQ